MFLIDDMLLSPLKGLLWLGEKINDIVEREMSDEGRIKEKIMELQLRFELDEIDEDEYDRQEQKLLAHLDLVRRTKEGVE